MPHEKLDPKRFPNLAALAADDRDQHVRAAMEMGLTREQALRHAENELDEE